MLKFSTSWYIYGLNPMVHIVTAYRAMLLWGIQPDWLAPFIIAMLTDGLLPIGDFIGKQKSPRFVEKL